VAGLTLDGIPGAALARRWGVPQCALFRSHASSLDAIHALGTEGAPAASVAVAEEQTAGRGRDGRTWRSPAGGVWLGMLVRPPAPILGALSLRVGLVVADVADALLGGARAQLKWPNDVLVNDRKLAGILCEGRWQGETLQWLAVGVGVNVANKIPAELAGRAIALSEVQPHVRRIDVLDRLVPALVACLTQRAELTEPELTAFATRDWLRGRQIRAPLPGRAAGVQADGALLVDTVAGSGVVREGHVELS
jgi:BirA family transcriptional regulator, biotin operon repressor / biotin---[acetyl-CoA-carboxylase] ligase